MKRLLLLLLLLPVFVTGQVITTYAGGGTIIGDGGPATVALLSGPNGGRFDKYGNYYIAESGANRVRKVSPSGIITRVAGTGSPGSSGDGGPATAGKLWVPTDVAVDTLGNVYISDLGNFKIRKVDGTTGVISTFAGTGTAGFGADNIPATDAQLQGNEQIWADKHGNLFICDRGNNRVRKVNATGIITTVAGHGGFSSGGTGDGGPATAATFNLITGIAVDDTGSLFIADFNCGRIRKVDTFGIITAFAGNGASIYTGDGMPATDAPINASRLTLDNSSELVIADQNNRRVYKIDALGIFHCIAGTGGTGHSGDGGPATAATLDFPAGVVFDTCGNLYIAETNNNDVRKVTFNSTCSPSLDIGITKNNSVISIYPNPANNELNIDNLKTISTYRLLNLPGKTLLQGTLKEGNNTISLQSLSSGMYLLELIDDEGRRVVRKVVKVSMPK